MGTRGMITFRPAQREQTSLMIGIAGPSSSGKTFSSLRLARGMMAGDDSKIFMIDTEGGRGAHYACAPGEAPGPSRFAFQYGELKAPFSPDAYKEAVLAAVDQGAGVVIVDSASHEHEGEGGILEMHEAELVRLAGQDFAKRERVKFTAWIRPKSAHNKYVNVLLQQRVHFIFAFRAKDKLAMTKNAKGQTEMVAVGWVPICPDRLEYEMTTLLMLPPNGKGVPDVSAPATKVQEQHKDFFPLDQPITETSGARLAAWALGSPGGTDPGSETSKPSLGKPGSAGLAAGAPTAPDKVDRGLLKSQITGAADKLGIPKDERTALGKKLLGGGTIDTADISAVQDLLTAVRAWKPVTP